MVQRWCSDGARMVQGTTALREVPGTASHQLAQCKADVHDVDVHVIPAWRADPAHEHHDVRFVFRAGAGQPLSISQESTELAWFEWAGLDAVGADQSLLRLARKARALLEAKSIL